MHVFASCPVIRGIRGECDGTPNLIHMELNFPMNGVLSGLFLRKRCRMESSSCGLVRMEGEGSPCWVVMPNFAGEGLEGHAYIGGACVGCDYQVGYP